MSGGGACWRADDRQQQLEVSRVLESSEEEEEEEKSNKSAAGEAKQSLICRFTVQKTPEHLLQIQADRKLKKQNKAANTPHDRSDQTNIWLKQIFYNK